MVEKTETLSTLKRPHRLTIQKNSFQLSRPSQWKSFSSNNFFLFCCKIILPWVSFAECSRQLHAQVACCGFCNQLKCLSSRIPWWRAPSPRKFLFVFILLFTVAPIYFSFIQVLVITAFYFAESLSLFQFSEFFLQFKAYNLKKNF